MAHNFEMSLTAPVLTASADNKQEGQLFIYYQSLTNREEIVSYMIMEDHQLFQLPAQTLVSVRAAG